MEAKSPHKINRKMRCATQMEPCTFWLLLVPQNTDQQNCFYSLKSGNGNSKKKITGFERDVLATTPQKVPQDYIENGNLRRGNKGE
jgi:hypothetical protein